VFLGAVGLSGGSFFHRPVDRWSADQSIDLDPTKTATFDDEEKQDLGGKVQEFRTKVTAEKHWVAASI